MNLSHLTGRKIQRSTERRQSQRTTRRRQAIASTFEPLEQRRMLAAVMVDNVSDAVNGDITSIASLIASHGGDGISFREAILAANNTPGADRITFHPLHAGVRINTLDLAITDHVEIQGPRERPVMISGPAFIFGSHDGAGRILNIAPGAIVSISNLNLMNGDATVPNGSPPTGEAFGGAIRNAGALTVRQCLFYHNGAGEVNPIGAGGGGAIYNSGSLTVIDCSFAANFAYWGSGGAIYNAGTAAVTNSTFIDNYVGFFGGAIYNAVGHTMTVTNCTILKCGGDPQGPVLGFPIGNHGIVNWGTMHLNNTIVADTPVGSDVANFSIIITGSHNLIKDGSGGVPGTITGDPMLAAPVYTQANSQFPVWAMLPRPGQYGPPFSFSPLAGSPAIDMGNNVAVSSFVDQRGAPRINNGVVDLGAVEVAIVPISIVVNTLTDEDSGSIDPAFGAGTSLREALSLKLPEHTTITFAPGLTGTIALDASLGSLQISDFHVTMPYGRGEVTIVGPAAEAITIDGLGLAPRILSIDGGRVSISGLTFARGYSPIDPIYFQSGGGAIFNRGDLTLNHCAFLENTTISAGGAIQNYRTLIVNSCTFVANAADQGGAIANFATMTVTGSTFTGNSARRGGAIWAQAYNPIHSPFIRPVVTSSTFSENWATELGGAIYIGSDRGPAQPAELTVINSTVSNNSAGLNGGGIFVGGDLTLHGSTVYGNSAASAGPTVAGGIAIGDNAMSFDVVRTVSLVNNIVAGSTSGADLTIFILYNGTVTGSDNLIGDGSGGLPNTITGSPLLGPLADNGGPTRTHALLPGSPAINAGIAIDGVTTDQRGVTRPQGSLPDIGAYERQATSAALTSTGYEFETRQAITFSFNDDASVTFSRSSFTLENLTTGQPVSAATGALGFNAAGDQATLVLTNLLPDADYRVTGLSMPLDFFVLAGDANRDRSVNIADFAILAARFNQPGVFSQGDFNYDGVTDIGDFATLASKFNTSLPALFARPGGGSGDAPVERPTARLAPNPFAAGMVLGSITDPVSAEIL